jgi:hypothetical protein
LAELYGLMMQQMGGREKRDSAEDEAYEGASGELATGGWALPW